MFDRTWIAVAVLIMVALSGCAKEDAKFVDPGSEETQDETGGHGVNESLPPELQYEEAYVDPNDGLVLGEDAAFRCTSIAESVVDIDPNSTFDGQHHAHNYWAGGDELVIFDGEISEFNAGWFAVDGAVVHPGASKSTFELTWLTGVNGVVGRQLHVDLPRLNVGPSVGIDYVLNFTESGQTQEVEYTYVQNDPAHAVKTEWRFKMLGWTAANEAAAGPLYDIATSRVWGTEAGAFHLKWTIHRGYDCLPVDPPHYDQWQNQTILILQDVRTEHSITRYNSGLPYGFVASGGYYGFRNGGVGYQENSTVPEGAKLVRVEMVWDNPGRPETTPHLEYVTAEEDALSGSTEWFRPDPVIDEDNRRVYDIDVQEGQHDSPYRKTSLWDFRFQLEDEVLGEDSGMFEGTIDWLITVYHASEVVPVAT